MVSYNWIYSIPTLAYYASQIADLTLEQMTFARFPLISTFTKVSQHCSRLLHLFLECLAVHNYIVLVRNANIISNLLLAIYHCNSTGA